MPTAIIRKVLLVMPPAVMEVGAAENMYNANHAFNLGLAYLAGLLRQHDFTVSILDCLAEDRFNVRSVDSEWQEVGLSNERIIDHVRAFGPDLVGVSIPFSCQHDLAMELIRQIKTAFPDIVLVAGANHVSALPDKIERSWVDYLIIGEGEFALLHLIHALNRSESIERLQGVVSKESTTYHHAPFIQNLDDLPFPAIDLLPLRKLWGSGRRWINMVATRGCVYDCNFCSIHTIMGYPIRRRSIENVIAEIGHWRQIYKIQEIYFEDDNLTTNAKWAKELFRRIAENKFGIRFYARNGIRADSIDKELLILMKAAGFHDFYIAPESGSQQTLDEVIGKRMKLEDCTRAVKLAREVGIGVNAFFVLGFPHETWKDIEATIEYARYLKSLGCERFWLSVATPYPGTRLYNQCLEHGSITEDVDYRKLRVAKSVINNRDFTSAELEAFRNRAMDELNPHPLPVVSTAKKGLSLLINDPSFFLVKLNYKLGVLF